MRAPRASGEVVTYCLHCRAERLGDERGERGRENHVWNSVQARLASDGEHCRERGQQSGDDEIRAAARMDRERALAVLQTRERAARGVVQFVLIHFTVDIKTGCIGTTDQTQRSDCVR